MQAEAAFSPPGMVLDELSSDRLPEMRKSRMVPASFFATAASGILQTSSDRTCQVSMRWCWVVACVS